MVDMIAIITSDAIQEGGDETKAVYDKLVEQDRLVEAACSSCGDKGWAMTDTVMAFMQRYPDKEVSYICLLCSRKMNDDHLSGMGQSSVVVDNDSLDRITAFFTSEDTEDSIVKALASNAVSGILVLTEDVDSNHPVIKKVADVMYEVMPDFSGSSDEYMARSNDLSRHYLAGRYADYIREVSAMSLVIQKKFGPLLP